jgi:hypothetical protein
MLPIAETSWNWMGGDLIVAIAVIGLAVYGWRQGVFVATLIGLQVLASFVAALALASLVVDLVRAAEIVPPGRLLAVAYLVTFLACVVGIRLAIGAFVPEMAVPFAPLLDGGLGLFIGAVAGYLLAGALLVAWSLAALPGPLRFTPAGLGLDPGSFVLKTFARCVAVEPARRTELLEGNAGAKPEHAHNNNAGATKELGPPWCSEPFVDLDGDGKHAAGELFLDVDGNGTFTPSLGFRDIGNDRRRRLGLLECYRLGAWEGITVWHAPEITSQESVRLESAPTSDEPIYRATARDPDGDAGLVFSLRLPSKAVRVAGGSGAPAVPLVIDPQTGAVSLAEEPTDKQQRQKKFEFTVIVTDPTGLTDERAVNVNVN